MQFYVYTTKENFINIRKDVPFQKKIRSTVRIFIFLLCKLQIGLFDPVTNFFYRGSLEHSPRGTMYIPLQQILSSTGNRTNLLGCRVDPSFIPFTSHQQKTHSVGPFGNNLRTGCSLTRNSYGQVPQNQVSVSRRGILLYL